MKIDDDARRRQWWRTYVLWRCSAKAAGDSRAEQVLHACVVVGKANLTRFKKREWRNVSQLTTPSPSIASFIPSTNKKERRRDERKLAAPLVL